MKKYDIYFSGSKKFFVSSIFLFHLINFTKKNPKFNLRYIINTDDIDFNNQDIYLRIRRYVKNIIFYIFNRNYYYLLKATEDQLREKKDIIFQAERKKIKYDLFSNFKGRVNKENAILINVGGTKIFKKNFLDKFKFCINYHHAELPKFRGANSNSFSIFHNKKNTFFSFHFMSSKIDRGFVFYKFKIPLQYKKKHHLFYELIKINLASKNIKKIFYHALKKKKYRHFLSKKGNYFPIKFYKKFFLNLNKYSFEVISRYIKIFGGIYYNENFITGIKKTNSGIALKDCHIKISEINYFPVFFYKLITFLSIIKKI